MAHGRLRDSVLSDDNNLQVEWRNASSDNSKAKIKYLSAQKGESHVFICRKKSVNDPSRWKIIVTESYSFASTYEVLFVTGKTLQWASLTETGNLPRNRLDINTWTVKGKAYIGATQCDQIGAVVRHGDQWMATDNDENVVTAAVKVLAVTL